MRTTHNHQTLQKIKLPQRKMLQKLILFDAVFRLKPANDFGPLPSLVIFPF